jgi:ACR3 family arsenite efflux pump ArsB
MAALLLANFIFVPLLVWAATRGLVEHPAILIGALLVLLTPCIDYVVVFTHIGKGDSRLTLAATPLLLLAQLVLLPVYLALMLGGSSQVAISITPFVEAFVLLIVLPMALAVLTSAGARHSRAVATWNDAWAWLPVPAMALVLMVVIASQIVVVLRDFDRLLPVVPVYIGFMLLAPVLGFICARLLRLPASEARSVTFSAATRNSLVGRVRAAPLSMMDLTMRAILCASSPMRSRLAVTLEKAISMRRSRAVGWRRPMMEDSS